MKARSAAKGEVRMMDIMELCSYIGLGRNSAREFAEAHGAMIKVGRRCLYDRVAIDNALDNMRDQKAV